MGTKSEETRRNRYYLFEKEVNHLFRGILLLNSNQFEDVKSHDDSFTELSLDLGSLVIQQTKRCPLCQSTFSTRDQQTLHYKSPWHLFNLRQKILGYKPVSEKIFKEFEDDIQSASSSDEESPQRKKPIANVLQIKEECPKPTKTRHHSKIYLKNDKGQILSLFRTTIHGRHNVPQTAKELLYSITCLPSQLMWAIILVGGGHFAASIFNGEEIVCHKTLRRYTVRAKQGGAQRTKDNQTGAAHSAGATLRRKNQMELDREIQTLLNMWSDKLSLCDRIFYQSPGLNQSTLFAGKNPPLKKTDPRIRSIPFTTKKPTFNETQRVHKILASIEVHEALPEMLSTISKDEECDLLRYSESSSEEETIKEAREEIQLDPQPEKSESAPALLQASNEAIKESKDEVQLEPQPEKPEPASALAQASNDLKNDVSSKEKKKKKLNQKNQSDKGEEENRPNFFKKQLEESCQMNDVSKLKELLSSLKTKEAVDGEGFACILNDKLYDNGNTLLHIAAAKGSKDIIYLLLEEGSDPAIKNGKGQPPYVLGMDKETREVFRRFMGSYPQKYDYEKSQIPSPLTDEMALQRAQKNLEKKKEKKKKQKLKKSEEEQIKNFLSLDDNEKVKINAELIAKFERALVRCVTCGEKLNDRTPFEYFDFKFCSVNCLRVHRYAAKQ